MVVVVGNTAVPLAVRHVPSTNNGGAGAGVLNYQDTAQVHPCSLILGVLPRKVLVSQYPHPSFNQTAVHLSETFTL